MRTIKKIITSLIWRIPFLRRAYVNKIKFNREKIFLSRIDKGIPVFILTVGKVASSSIYNSLQNVYDGNVVHAHSFKKDHKDIEVKLLYNLCKKGKIKIISLIREPISRNWSDFFQNFEREVGVKYENNTLSLMVLQNLFVESKIGDYGLNWFDNQIKCNFNIDVYEKSFPEVGYSLYENENVELLLMRFDISDFTKEIIISNFLNIDNFKLRNENIGSLKSYSDIYGKIQKLKLPKWYVDKMLNSKYSQHFFKNKIDSIRKKWSEAE